MIEFQYVNYKNFQSAGNQPIQIDLNRSQSTMISGQNGSGKSQVLEALTYGLFGKPLKKVTIGGLINTINKKNLLVEVVFKKQGITYKVIRGQKPSVLEFWVNDQLVDQSANARDYQAKIEYVLGMDYKLFTQIVVLNKEKYVPFMELGAADRRKIVEDILDIAVFSYMSDELKLRTSTLNNDIEDLKYERAKIETKIVGQQRLIAEANSNVDAQVESIKTNISLLQTDKSEAESLLETLNKELDNLGDVSNEVSATEKRKREFEQISAKFVANSDSIKKTLEFFTRHDNCPTCGQEIEETLKQEKSHECNTKIGDIAGHAKLLSVEYSKVIAELNDLKQTVNKIQEIKNDIRVHMNTISRIDRDISAKERELDLLTRESKVGDYETELEQYQEEFKDRSDLLESLMKTKEVYDKVKSILKDDGIKVSIVRDYIQFINQRVNEYLATMEFYLNIQLDENFNDSIKAVNREGFVYDNLSTGQKTRVSLAVYLALLEVASLKNSVVTNIICIDEILENLDSVGVQLVVKLFREKFGHKNLFVITQRADEFADLFRSEIKFILKDGFTEKL
jgi:DNA repair exonuclease SbcCD ATPase subunit